MRTAEAIIIDLGGLTTVANETGIPLTTVAGWKDANFIPEWRRPALQGFAKRIGKPLPDSDFPPVAARIPRSKRQEGAAA